MFQVGPGKPLFYCARKPTGKNYQPAHYILYKNFSFEVNQSNMKYK